MVQYNLEHLTQTNDQWVCGPLQDDEALFLFALIRCMRVKTVLELGGLDGYSAINFIKAVGHEGRVYTVDIHPVERRAHNHICIQKDCRALTSDDVPEQIDLVFYDCHVFEAQMAMHQSLIRQRVITDRTVLALHDTNLHPGPIMDSNAKQVEGGYVHQAVERMMVNVLRNEGYEALNLHTRPEQHDETLRLRHGLTVLTKNRYLPV